MTLAFILGEGRLPRLLAAAHPDAHRLSLEGFAPDGVEVESFRIETLGSVLSGLRERGVDRVCLAGAVQRTEVDPDRIDAATAPLVPRLMTRMGQGDAALLSEVLRIFEEAGLTPVAAQDLLPDLLPEAGVLGDVSPSEADMADVSRGAEILAAIGPADLGQSCVVASGLALAVETLPGTDFMLQTLALARGDGPLHRGLPPGGVMVKAPKPGQDRRIDWPAIGPGTVAQAAAADLRGIAVPRGGALVLDRRATIAAADDAGLFLWIRE